MTKKQKLIWRLGKLPSVVEIQGLVNDKIITQEEAREILFSSETEEERDESSLKNEIKFLRELVDKLTAKLSYGRNTVVEYIREIERPYLRSPWLHPYQIWCDSGSISAGTTNTVNMSNAVVKFSNIKTF